MQGVALASSEDNGGRGLTVEVFCSGASRGDFQVHGFQPRHFLEAQGGQVSVD